MVSSKIMRALRQRLWKAGADARIVVTRSKRLFCNRGQREIM